MPVCSSISVVMPAFNAANTIASALRTIGDQLLKPCEIIVVDDGSTDATPCILEEMREKLSVKVIRNEKNLGISRSLNRGVRAASTKYIARLDADDKWMPEHLSEVYGILESHSLDLACSRARYVDSFDKSLRISRSLGDGTVRQRLMWDNPIVHSSVVFRKSTFDACGGYAEDVKWEDYDLWIKMLKMGSFGCTNNPTTIYTVTPDSLSRGSMRISLEGRWRCQNAAARAFWYRNPLVACSSLLISGVRLALMPKFQISR